MNDLTKGNELKTILFFSMPILIGNLFQQLYNIVDSIVVGNFLGKESLAAVGFSFQINSLLVTFSMGITMGTSILVSRCMGEKDLKRVKKIMDTGIFFSLVISIFITVIGINFCESILNIFRMPIETISMANVYLKIIFVGVIPTFAYNTLTNILRGMGDSKTATNILIIAMFLNTILDVTFVAIFHMGIAGAAAATVISQFFSWISCMVYINTKYPDFRINIIKLQFDRKELNASLKIGIPTMIQQVFICIGFLTVQYMINGFGTDCIAAYTAASKIDSFAEMPSLNLGKAITNFTAQNLGAEKNDRVKKGNRVAFILCAIISIIVSIVIIVVPEIFIKMFTQDLTVIEIGKGYLRIIAGFYIVFGMMQVVNGILLGHGKTVIPMLASIISLCLLQVPVAICLSQTMFSYKGVWIATPIGWTGGFIIRFTYYYLKIVKNNK